MRDTAVRKNALKDGDVRGNRRFARHSSLGGIQ